MDGFSRYNQIQIKLEDQHKTALIFSWGTFVYKNMPFGLKNARETLQRAMNFAFHDIKAIVEPYLDDLLTHSPKRIDHPDHLRLIFERCRYYKIRLNPHKCVFCVESGRLLGFIVSNRGIKVDPFTTTFRSKIRRKNPTARGFLFFNLSKITKIHFFFVKVAISVT